MTEPDIAKLASAVSPLNTYVLNLKLSDPAQAPAFASRYSTSSPAGPFFNTWEDSLPGTGCWSRTSRPSWCPALCSSACSRSPPWPSWSGAGWPNTTRRVGLLKAAGATPGLVAATFLAQNLALALIAAVAGLAAGWLAAPLLTSPGAALVGTPGAPSLTPLMVAGVVALALAVALASTLVPAIRAARSSTVSALADAARTPKRRGGLISLSRRLPVPVLFGLRLAARRPRRALLSAASIAVTVAGIVAVLAFHATVTGNFRAGFRRAGQPGHQPGRADAGGDHRHDGRPGGRQRHLHRLGGRPRRTALLGHRPFPGHHARGKTASSLLTTQLLPALAGALFGIPVGIALYGAVQQGGSRAGLPAGVDPPPGARNLLAVAALTAVPAKISTRQPIAQILQSETA